MAWTTNRRKPCYRPLIAYGHDPNFGEWWPKRQIKRQSKVKTAIANALLVLSFLSLLTYAVSMFA